MPCRPKASALCVLILFAVAYPCLNTSPCGAYQIFLTAAKTGLSRGSTFSMNIVHDDAAGIAGCSFSVLYPANVVEPGNPAVGTNFFKLFYDTRPKVSLSQAYPWIKNLSNPGLILLSGAYVNPSTGLGNYAGRQVLFTVHFKVKPDAPVGPFAIEVVRTMLCNGPKGWGVDQNNNGRWDPGDTYEAAPILVKANAQGSVEPFTVVLNAFNPNPLHMFRVAGPSDTDGDGIPDSVENTCCTEVNNPDTDNDGLWDGVEDKDRDCRVDAGETDPCNFDSDADELDDGFEDLNRNGTRQAGELDPLDPDCDNDGYKDGLETFAGCNPMLSTSYPYVVCIGTCDDSCDECKATLSEALAVPTGKAEVNYLRVRGNSVSDGNVSIPEEVLIGVESGKVNLQK
jgi:hypothetical protein